MRATRFSTNRHVVMLTCAVDIACLPFSAILSQLLAVPILACFFVSISSIQFHHSVRCESFWSLGNFPWLLISIISNLNLFQVPLFSQLFNRSPGTSSLLGFSPSQIGNLVYFVDIFGLRHVSFLEFFLGSISRVRLLLTVIRAASPPKSDSKLGQYNRISEFQLEFKEKYSPTDRAQPCPVAIFFHSYCVL